MRIRIPPNDVFLGWLAAQTDPPLKRVRARRKVGRTALRCHPDLCDRLESCAAGLPGVQLRYIGGLPVLVHANGVVFGVASGTTWLALRMPALGQRAVVRSQWGPRGLDASWVDVDPWIPELSAHDGTSRLRGWARAAFAYAEGLADGPTRARHAPPAPRRARRPPAP